MLRTRVGVDRSRCFAANGRSTRAVILAHNPNGPNSFRFALFEPTARRYDPSRTDLIHICLCAAWVHAFGDASVDKHPTRRETYFPVRLPLHLRQNGSLNLPYFCLVAFVESPLLNSLGAGQTCLTQNLHVFARGRLTDSKLARNQASANPILYQIAVDLRREVFSRVLKPFENL